MKTDQIAVTPKSLSTRITSLIIESIAPSTQRLEAGMLHLLIRKSLLWRQSSHKFRITKEMSVLWERPFNLSSKKTKVNYKTLHYLLLNTMALPYAT